MKGKPLIALLILLSLSTSGEVAADSVIDMQWMFSGRNVYAPTLVQNGIYQMWYGGWQSSSDYPNDKIYYRTSYDNVHWSSPTTVLTPWQIGQNVVHVNDPTVTVHFNEANGQWQYTMFYTVCVSPCNQSDNQIWSSVSGDGVHWVYHTPLLVGLGPAEPSVIIDPQADGTFWKVYYVDRLDATIVKMAKVSGDRNMLAVQSVFAGPGTISSAEVKEFNGKWHLFFNAFFADRVDLYKSESSTNESWPAEYEVLITNPGPSYCATVTPGVLSAGGDQYDLYFGLTPRLPSGGCDISQQQSIQRWRWVD
jgi:hypothetical protein